MEKSTDSGATLCPRDLYRVLCRLVPMAIYDQSSLKDWESWEDFFERSLESGVLHDTEEDALECAQAMLDTLGDRFCCALNAAEVKALYEVIDEPFEAAACEVASGIGCVRITSFMNDGVAQEVETALASLGKCDALIVDLRGNDGGQVNEAVRCAQLLITQGCVVVQEERVFGGGYRRREVSLTDERLQVIDTDGDTGALKTHEEARFAPVIGDRPLVVLVDDGTASSAELLAAALQDAGACVIGRKTVGKGIVQNLIPVNEQAGLYLTTSRFYSPRGEWLGDAGATDATGISPDIEVPAASGDALEEAVQYLRARLNRAA